MAAGNRTLSLVEVNEDQTRCAGFPSDLLNLYGEAMDRALGIERASLSAMVEMNACARDTCERLAGGLLDAVVGAISSCLQAQLSWFTLLAPRVDAGSKAQMSAAAPAGADHSMDVVLGEGGGGLWSGVAESIADAGGPVLARPAEEEAPERGMDLAIGETAA